MLIKSAIKMMLHTVGLDLVRYVPEFERPFDIRTLIVERHLETQRPFFFVQVGANDGIQDDPLRTLILRHKLRGLLVEPIPDIFKLSITNTAIFLPQPGYDASAY